MTWVVKASPGTQCSGVASQSKVTRRGLMVWAAVTGSPDSQVESGHEVDAGQPAADGGGQAGEGSSDPGLDADGDHRPPVAHRFQDGGGHVVGAQAPAAVQAGRGPAPAGLLVVAHAHMAGAGADTGV